MLYTVKPVYSGHMGEIDKMTTIYRPVFQLGIEKGRGATLEKGDFSTSKTKKKGNTVIFSYLILKMSFSTTFSAPCIKFNASTWIIVFLYLHMCRNAVKIKIKKIKRHAKKNISVMNVPVTILTKIKVTLCLQVFCFCV